MSIATLLDALDEDWDGYAELGRDSARRQVFGNDGVDGASVLRACMNLRQVGRCLVPLLYEGDGIPSIMPV